MATDIRDLDRRAVEACRSLVASVTDADLDRPTPCTSWRLHDLLEHLTAQHRGFAAAAAGHGGDLARWASRPSTAPVADHLTAADEVLAAFAEPGTLDRPFVLAEFDPTAPFPAATAISFHFLDYLVHSWDVATALGVSWEPDADLLQPALAVALTVPDGTERVEPDAAFAPGSDPGGAGAFDRILALLGRSPTWSPA